MKNEVIFKFMNLIESAFFNIMNGAKLAQNTYLCRSHAPILRFI